MNSVLYKKQMQNVFMNNYNSKRFVIIFYKEPYSFNTINNQEFITKYILIAISIFKALVCLKQQITKNGGTGYGSFLSE